VDEARHFAQAAERCYVTQPTLSMRLRNLEEEVGVELVHRGQRFEGFTAAGQLVLAWAHSLLAAEAGLYAEAAACRGQLHKIETSSVFLPGSRVAESRMFPTHSPLPYPLHFAWRNLRKLAINLLK
jgi:DNA-binding transcriptional LysR family regulator